jgi:thiamine-phosphate pyrophosphorylase
MTCPAELRRARLDAARVMLLFTPELCSGRDPAEILAVLLPEVDAVQVRVKPVGGSPRPAGTPGPPAEARGSLDWTRRALRLRDELAPRALVLVDDRVDVALALAAEGCDGVHVGRGDLAARDARALLGPELLLGLSTHDVGQVLAAAEEPVDYLGFGPVFATATKGYAAGHGPELAWVASAGSALPLFPIGGIDLVSAPDLAEVGRAAVSAALLSAEDPVAAARALRAALGAR